MSNKTIDQCTCIREANEPSDMDSEPCPVHSNRTSNPLVARLRDTENNDSSDMAFSGGLCMEAADEIERLTAELGEWTSGRNELRVRAERERFRLALELIRSSPMRLDCRDMYDIASKALAGAADEPIRDRVLPENIRGGVSDETDARRAARALTEDREDIETERCQHYSGFCEPHYCKLRAGHPGECDFE